MSMHNSRTLLRAAMLEHTVKVIDATEDDYDRLIEFIKKNVPTTDRATPKFRKPAWNEGDSPTRLIFRFRNEEQAMAFKLVV